MTNIQVFLNHASANQDGFHDNLKSVSDKISRHGITLPSALMPLRNYFVDEAVIGPGYLAFRLSDGRVCRTSYSVHPEKLTSATTTTSSTTASNRKRDARRRLNTSDNSGGGTGGTSGSGSGVGSTGNSSQSSVSAVRDIRSSRFLSHSFFTSTRGRGLMRDLRRGLLMPPSRSPIVPASEVPEELVQQAQAVLQGKSRQVIIRELQRTSLDVNMAVNNLLSRDDEGGGDEPPIGGSGGAGAGGSLEEWEDDIPDDLVPYIESAERAAESGYMIANAAEQDVVPGGAGGPLPIGDDLFSYAGPHGGSSGGGSGRPRWGRITATPNEDADGDSGRPIARGSKRRRLEISAMRMLGAEPLPLADDSRESGGGRSKERSGDRGSGGTAVSGGGGQGSTEAGSETGPSAAVQFGEELQFWMERDGSCPTFKAIGALHSELVGVSTGGQLHQWRWSDCEPFVGASGRDQHEPVQPRAPRHPRAAWLGVDRERIQMLSCCQIRASILTESGQVATWLDEVVAPLANRLEHQATAFETELATADRIVGISVASLVTVAYTSSGHLYWWGVLPSDSRRKVFDKVRHRTTGASGSSGAARPYAQSLGTRGCLRVPQPSNAGGCVGSGLVPGAYVSMKNAPVFHAGAIGFTIVDGVPKVGVLLEDAWSISAVCRFRIRNATALAADREKKAANAAAAAAAAPGGVCSTAAASVASAVPPSSSSCGNVGQFSPAMVGNAATPPPECPEKMGGTVAMETEASWRDITAAEPPGSGPDLAVSGANSGAASAGAGGTSSDADKIDMPPPPSPASSTCSDQSGPILVSPGSLKRKKATTPLRDIPSSEANFSQYAAAAAAHTRSGGNGRGGNGVAATAGGGSGGVGVDVVEEEEWCLASVIFLEDGRSQPVGRVLKIDGNIVAVRFLERLSKPTAGGAATAPPSSGGAVAEPLQSVSSPVNAMLLSSEPAAATGAAPGAGTSPSDPSVALLADCRLLKRDDLVLVKNPTCSRSPEFYQRTPRRLPVPTQLVCLPGAAGESAGVNGQHVVLSMTVTNADVHMVVRSHAGSQVRLSYQVYSLHGKHVQSLRLMTHAPAFLGRSADNVRIIGSGEAEKPMLLLDGNSCIYAMHKLGNDCMSPPGWLDLPALRCATIATVPMPRSATHTGQNAGSGRGVLTVLGLEAYSLMPHILRCDVERVREILTLVHAKPDGEEKAVLLAEMMAERCDGHRNALHVAIAMCAPQSNRETNEGETAGDDSSSATPAASGGGGGGGGSGSGNVSSARIRRISVQPSNDGGGSVHDVFIRRVHSRYQEMRRQLNQHQQQQQQQQQQHAHQQSQQNSLMQAMQQGWRQVSGPSSQDAGSSGSRREGVPALGHSVTISSSLLAVAAVAAQDAGLSRTGTDLSQAATPLPAPGPAGPGLQWYLPPVTAEESELRENARQIVGLLCRHPLFDGLASVDSPSPLLTLLCSANVHGHTPFQHAVACRAYPVANAIFDVITELAPRSANRKEIRMSAIFPSGSASDDSPLHMLCHNDTCTFTWTGPDHIRQDIFECRTCGLMDSLCCCTECARVCHRGHDCRLKRTSPTAYCDCWEKCRCKALVAGSQASRQTLLGRLLQETDLAVRPNKRGEHILLFLVKTVARQMMEQRNFRPHRRRTLHQRYPSIMQMHSPISFEFQNDDGSLPEHDLEPPKFCRRALETVLSNWQAVESMLLGEYKGQATGGGDAAVPRDMEDLHMHYQSGAIHLDQFVFGLMSGRCSPESGHVLDTLLATIIREMQAEPGSERAAKARLAASRLVRAVIRLYLLLSVQVSPNHARPKGFLNTGISFDRSHQPLDLCCRVFVCLITVALEELPRQADALFAPVRLGVVRPTSPFQLHSQVNDALPASEQLFAADPLLAQAAGGLHLGGDVGSPLLRPGGVSASRTRSGLEEAEAGEQMDVDDVLDAQDSVGVGDGVVSADGVAPGPDEAAAGVAGRAAPLVEEDLVESDSDSEMDNFDSGSQLSDRPRRRRRNATESSVEYELNEPAVANAAPAGQSAQQGGSGSAPAAESGGGGGSGSGEAAGGGGGGVSRRGERQSSHTVGISRRRRLLAHRSEAGGGNGSGAAAGGNSGSSGRHSSSRARSSSSPTSPNYSDASDSDPPSPSGGEHDSQHNSDEDEEEEDEISPDEDSFIYEPSSPHGGLLSPDDFLGQLLSNRSSALSSFPPAPSNNTNANVTSSGMAWAVRGSQRAEGRERGLGDSSTTGGSGGGGAGGGNSGGRSSSGVRLISHMITGVSGSSSGGNSSSNAASENVGANSSLLLARGFAILVRLSADLLNLLPNYHSQQTSPLAEVIHFNGQAERSRLQRDIEVGFKDIWRWLAAIMDAAEAQLRYGNSLNRFMDSLGQGPAGQASRFIGGYSDTEPVGRPEASTSSSRGQRRGIPAGSSSSGGGGGGGGGGGTSNTPPLPGEASRREFLSYMLSLMRGASDEHADLLPIVDLGAYRHVAYVTDAFLYLIKETSEGPPVGRAPVVDTPVEGEPMGLLWEDAVALGRRPVDVDEQELEEVSSMRATIGSNYDDDSDRQSTLSSASRPSLAPDPTARPAAVRRSHAFFQRSPSTLALGCPGPDPIQTPLEKALPLAYKPHLLTPGARRQDLFGVAQPAGVEQDLSSLRHHRNDNLPIHLGLVSSWADREGISGRLRPADLLSRWHLTLEMFGRLFAEEVGAEPRSTILELGGFPVKETRFRKEMERIRNQSRRDLSLDVDRQRDLLIAQTFRQLNAEFFKRQGGASTPLQCHRMKVTFKDEPGEGSGVARSFFTAFAQGVLSEDQLPPLDSIATQRLMPTPRYSLVGRSGRRSGVQMGSGLGSVSDSSRQSLGARPGGQSGPSSLQQSAIRRVASAMAAVGHSAAIPGLLRRSDSPSSTADNHMSAASAGSPSEMSLLDTILSSNESAEGMSSDSGLCSSVADAADDLSPLFWQPGKPGFYSPRMARMSLSRQMAYRNVGRVMGLCLLMGEICPLRFSRHVLKFLMGRNPQWHDMAFFDPSMYEGMRQLLLMADQNNAEAILNTELYFTIRLGGDEGPEQVFDLVPNGNAMRVTIDNVFDYVRLYCEFRMIRSVKSTLEQMRLGLYDVVPTNAFEGVTAEDLRLLLNGAGEIDVGTLQSYTVFSDESGESNKKVARFKKWFWQCLERMTQTQRQDLVYFWTSSPALPASEQGFQPTPSVTVRPADDQHLPTANTCISRLYIPLYSSKHLLRTKLLQAIETKSFGFV